MKKIALVILSLGFFSINSWGCSFESSLMALKGLDSAVAENASYKVSTGDTIVIGKSGSQMTISGLPACASGSGSSATISISIPDETTGKLKRTIVNLVKHGKIILASYKDMITGAPKHGTLTRN